MIRESDATADFRLPTASKWAAPRAVADGGGGTIIATAEIVPPHKLVMTRKFEKHPLQGTRETTITYRLEPVGSGTPLTMREEGYIGRSEAAYGNAEHWERVLAWLDSYMRRIQ